MVLYQIINAVTFPLWYSQTCSGPHINISKQNHGINVYLPYKNIFWGSAICKKSEIIPSSNLEKESNKRHIHISSFANITNAEPSL